MSDTVRLDTEFRVDLGHRQMAPDITGLQTGGFAFVSTADTGGGPVKEVKTLLQIYNALGSLSTSTQLSTGRDTLFADAPTVITLTSGDLLAGYTAYDPNDPGAHTFTTGVFDTSGNPIPAPDPVVEDNLGSNRLSDGRYMTVSVSNDASLGDGSGSSIVGQIFNSDGSPATAKLLVNSTTSFDQSEPAVASLPDDRFVVVFTDFSKSPDDPSGRCIRAQLFNADGTPSGSEFLVNTTTQDNQYSPAVTALADGRFAVSYLTNNTGGADIIVQIFDPRSEAVDISGTAGNDSSVGTPFDDFLTGLGGSDLLRGGDGQDHIDGGQGIDIADYGESHQGVVVNLGMGAGYGGTADGDVLISIERVYGSLLDDMLTGSRGKNTLRGFDGDDRLDGQAGADQLDGGSGDDVMSGGRGNDVLRGNAGQDEMRGGIGDDRFIFMNTGEFRDRIFDFSSSAAGDDDVLQFLSSAVGGLDIGTLDPISFQSSTSHHALTNHVRFYFDTDTAKLLYDADGARSGAAVLVAALQPGAVVTTDDIVIF